MVWGLDGYLLGICSIVIWTFIVRLAGSYLESVCSLCVKSVYCAGIYRRWSYVLPLAVCVYKHLVACAAYRLPVKVKCRSGDVRSFYSCYLPWICGGIVVFTIVAVYLNSVYYLICSYLEILPRCRRQTLDSVGRAFHVSYLRIFTLWTHSHRIAVRTAHSVPAKLYRACVRGLRCQTGDLVHHDSLCRYLLRIFAVVICTLIVTLAGSYFKFIASCVKSYDSVAVCICLRYLLPLAVFQHKDTIVWTAHLFPWKADGSIARLSFKTAYRAWICGGIVVHWIVAIDLLTVHYLIGSYLEVLPRCRRQTCNKICSVRNVCYLRILTLWTHSNRIAVRTAHSVPAKSYWAYIRRFRCQPCDLRQTCLLHSFGRLHRHTHT